MKKTKEIHENGNHSTYSREKYKNIKKKRGKMHQILNISTHSKEKYEKNEEKYIKLWIFEHISKK